jgi:hypothetical protein
LADDVGKVKVKSDRLLEYLIPAGIINLKDDNEIKRGLERIENRVKAPRLWLWKSEIEQVGYKKFFQTALHSGNLSDPKSILGVITKIKTDNFKKEDSKKRKRGRF